MKTNPRPLTNMKFVVEFADHEITWLAGFFHDSKDEAIDHARRAVETAKRRRPGERIRSFTIRPAVIGEPVHTWLAEPPQERTLARTYQNGKALDLVQRADGSYFVAHDGKCLDARVHLSLPTAQAFWDSASYQIAERPADARTINDDMEHYH